MRYRCFISLLMVISIVIGLAACGNQAAVPEVAPQQLNTDAPVTEETEEASGPVASAEKAKPTVPAETDGYKLSYTLNDQGKPVISWPEADGAVVYELYCDLSKGMDCDPLIITEKTSYTHANAAQGQSYFYLVRAVDSGGDTVAVSSATRFSAATSTPETPVTQYINIPKVKLHHVAETGEDPVELPYMAEVGVGNIVLQKKTGAWYRIFYEGELYYLFKKYSEQTFTDTRSTFQYIGNTVYQQNALDLAVDICMNWKTVYKDGGKGDIVDDAGTRAYHCSGLVSFILNGVMEPIVPAYWVSANMVRLYETDAIYNAGLPGELKAQDVPLSDLQPGDVLFFRSQLDTTGSMTIGHCGLYLGNNEFLHCTSVWEKGVCIMPLTNDFKTNLLKIRRYLPETAVPAEVQCTVEGPYDQFKLYGQRNFDSKTLRNPKLGDVLVLLYDGTGNWAYVRTEDGTEGFFPRKYLRRSVGE